MLILNFSLRKLGIVQKKKKKRACAGMPRGTAKSTDRSTLFQNFLLGVIRNEMGPSKS